jgi:hypothetical protein
VNKGPRFRGFVTAPLSQLRDAVTLPDNLSTFGHHDCFGYRVLIESFENTESLQSVIELCGTSDLRCPTNGSPLRSPSPIHISPPTKHTLFIPSPSPPNHARVITTADYLDDEEFEEYFSKLTQPAEGVPTSAKPGPSNATKVVRHLSPLIILQLHPNTASWNPKARETATSGIARQCCKYKHSSGHHSPSILVSS